MFMSDLLKTESVASATAKNNVAARFEEVVKNLDRERAKAEEEVGVQLLRLRETRSSLTKRHELQRRRELEREIDDLQKHYDHVVSGRKLEEFKHKAAPFVRDFKRRRFETPCHVNEDAEEEGHYDAYLSSVEGTPPRLMILPQELCDSCGVAMENYQSFALLVCVKCGASRPLLEATVTQLSFSNDCEYVSNFSYKRVNHFSEWLSSIQAKETIEVPEVVLSQVRTKLLEERVENLASVSVQRVREVLKKLKLRKYYEHVQLITCRITGAQPPRMTPEMEERIKSCFMAASASFQRHCPPERKNMISYQSVLYKLCQLLGYEDFMPYFTLLKCSDKMNKVDSLWKKICEDWDWDFIPSSVHLGAS